MARVKKLPQRICIGCRQNREKRQMIRIVRTPEGQVIIDPTGKLSGRGAYICKDSLDCLEAALKGGQLERALNVKVPDEIIRQLRERIAKKT